MMVLFRKYICLSVLGVLLFFSYSGFSQCPSVNQVSTYEGQSCPCQMGSFSIDLTSSADSIKWKFGDGSDTTAIGPLSYGTGVHTYSASGTYTVWMVFYGPSTCKDSVSITFAVDCFNGVCPSISYLNQIGISGIPFGSPCSAFEFWFGPCSNNVIYYPNYYVVQDTIPVLWDFGDNTTQIDTLGPPPMGGSATNHAYGAPGIYTVTLTFLGPGACTSTRSLTVEVDCGPPPCSDCISSFAPIPGKKYLVSAWVKEDTAAQYKTSYNYPSITITYPSLASSVGPFFASGHIIDRWQRLEAEFTIPPSSTDIGIKLDCSTGDCLFDDVRLQPFDASMKSYVYDPITMRLVAELDERNYATIYEYDEEGKLIRVKKETEKGVMTIKENRNNTKKN